MPLQSTPYSRRAQHPASPPVISAYLLLTASGGSLRKFEEVHTMKTIITLILALALFHTPPILAENAEQPAQQTADSYTAKKATQNSDDDC